MINEKYELQNSLLVESSKVELTYLIEGMSSVQRSIFFSINKDKFVDVHSMLMLLSAFSSESEFVHFKTSLVKSITRAIKLSRVINKVGSSSLVGITAFTSSDNVADILPLILSLIH